MVFHFKQDHFAGPLDLLLELIEQDKLNISKISLSRVANEYIRYVKSLEKIDPEQLAEFLVVAAQLMLIKSRTLLPTVDLGLEEGEFSLADQLRMYKVFRDAAKGIEEQIKKKRFLFPREKPPVQIGLFQPPKT